MPSSTCRPGREGLLLIIPVVIALSQASCAPDTHSYGPSDIGRVVSDGNVVTITHASGEADARPLAEGYCAKFDKTARFERMILFRAAHARFSSSSAVFICEPPSGRESKVAGSAGK